MYYSWYQMFLHSDQKTVLKITMSLHSNIAFRNLQYKSKHPKKLT